MSHSSGPAAELFDSVLFWANPPGEPQPDPRIVEWQRWWARHASRGPLVETTRELRAQGVTRAIERHRVAAGLWSAAGRGAVSRFDVRATDPFLRARRRHALAAAGAVRTSAGFVVSGRTAAVLHGLDLRDVPDQVELTRRACQRSGTGRGRRVVSAPTADEDVIDWFGVPVLNVSRTLTDVARVSAEDGIVAADHALRAHLITRDELGAAMSTAAGLPGCRRAREVLGLASPRAGSPLESLVRLALHDAGLPPPRLQYGIGPYEVDFAWPDLRLVLEADGLAKYDDPRARRDARSREKRREHALRRAGFRVERVTWDEATVGRAEFVTYFGDVLTQQADLVHFPRP